MTTETILHKPKYEIQSIDIAKFICASLIILLHTKGFVDISEGVNYYFNALFSRLAVPFFFLCSGYFFAAKAYRPGIDLADVRKKYLTRLLYPYLFWNLINAVYYVPFLIKHNGIVKGSLIYLQSLMFYAPGALWFVMAIMVAVAIISLVPAQRLRQLIPVALVLFVIGAFGNSYYGLLAKLPGVMHLYDQYFRIFLSTRNGLLFALPFVAIGAYFSWKPQNCSRAWLWVLIISGIFINVFEAFMLKNIQVTKVDVLLDAKDSSMYFAQILIVPALFLLLLKSPVVFKFSSQKFRDLSVGMYYCHRPILYFLDKMCSWLAIPFSYGIIPFVSVWILAFSATWTAQSLARKYNIVWLKRVFF